MKWLGASERSVMDEGQKILKRLDDLLGRTIHLGLKDPPNRPLQRLHAPLVVKDSDVFGRDGDKKEIIELLLSDDASGKNLSVIPIVGLGGVGKTTLAQLVYEDSAVQQHFALKVWVNVSENFNVFQVTKAIFQVTSPECNIGELHELQRELYKALAGKTFLFVLDDVWNEIFEQWVDLKSAFESGARGSKIIVTTRSKDVALTMSNRVMHELEVVSDQDCWRIFEKHAFDDSAEATPQLQEIGRKIVKRCKGLPLAVKSIAGLLRCASKPEGWRKILNSDIWQLQFQTHLKKQVVPAVWLSYHFLPPYLKRCFAYLSIFPKDYEFFERDMKRIIWLWMAEGLLEAEKGKKAEEVGEEYLQALIGRSFFQYSSQHESILIMHDIVHDLAKYISDKFSFEFNDSNDLSKLPTKACHLSLMCSKGSEVVEIMKGLTSQTRSLRAFLLLSLSYPGPIIEKSLLHDLFLKVGGCLRVLSLSHSDIEELPDSMGNMKYLRYLDLSGSSIEELSDSICTLYNLQTLLLSECRRLKRLPTRLAALVNLRHLDISYSDLIEELPDSICTLYNLQTLLLSACRRLKRLPTRLAALVNLRHLDISYSDLIEELPDSICTLYNLQTLILLGCSRLKEMPPQMYNLTNLQTLSNFVLGEGGGWRIKELGKLRLLRGSLRISGLEHIVEVEDVLEANLKDKEFLSELILYWGWWRDSNITSSQQEREREVLEALRPHTNLKQLTINDYGGKIFPDWVGHESFCNMVRVDLLRCRNVCRLPPLGQLSSLRRLEMSHLDGVVSIGNEFCGSSSTTTNHPFTSLEELKISDMGSLKEWSFSSDRLGQEGGVFPSLKELCIVSCKKLIVGLPDCHLPSLKSIDIRGCDEMVGVFVEMDTNAFPSLESACLLCIIKVCFEMVGVCQSRQKMDTNAFPSLQFMCVYGCRKLESLFGRQSIPSNLEVLEIRKGNY